MCSIASPRFRSRCQPASSYLGSREAQRPFWEPDCSSRLLVRRLPLFPDGGADVGLSSQTCLRAHDFGAGRHRRVGRLLGLGLMASSCLGFSLIEIRTVPKRAKRGKQAKAVGFRVGDRVRLSEFGKTRCPRTQRDVGRVVSVPEPTKGGKTVGVHFDGNKRPTPVHQSYIERM